MTIVYGIDTTKTISPRDVRDAIVLCFATAHSEALEDLKSYAETMSPEEFERIKIINVQQMIRAYFTEVGGDFESPTKDSIVRVMEKLKDFAVHFRNQQIIEKHYNEILLLVKAMP